MNERDSRIRPVEVELFFDDRPYELGETVEITVSLNPQGVYEIRAGRVDLVCEESWTETATIQRELRARNVHCSTLVTPDTRNQSIPGKHRVRLSIRRRPPIHFGKGLSEYAVTWKLVASVHTAHMSEIAAERAMNVTL